MAVKLDLVIKNGIVFDGTSGEPFQADIGIAGDKIAVIKKRSAISNQLSAIRAAKTIDAKRMAVSPGFIDTHAHSDFTLLADPRAEGKILQGVTTEINGNCGLSAAPLYGEASERREDDLRELGIKERWRTLREYFSILKKTGIVMNFVTLAGHGNIRASVIGYKDKLPSKNELKKMQGLLRDTIEEGAIGLSTGLIYPPGIYSDTDELVELCSGIRTPHSAFIYTSHMRSEGNKLIEAIKEIISIGKEAKIKVHVSHIKTAGRENWHKISEAISLIESARKKGVRITCDRYPYTAASTDLDTMLPQWTYEGGAEEELKRLKNQEVRERIKSEMPQKFRDNNLWKEVRVSEVNREESKWMEGKTMSYISKKLGKEPMDALFKVLIEEKLRVGAIFFSMNEDNLKRFLSLPYAMVGSDASVRSFSGPTRTGKPHPRAFGSFPRFLGRYVRDEKLMSMSEAVHKITMLPSKTFGIKGRGVIKNGAFADIVIFDPKKIIDKATFDRPFLKPAGIYYVIVNGAPAVWEGKFTGQMAGKILQLFI
ncbi:MAG: D-aminoacylase [Nitrospirae bacterium]|nr:MAG: D-aminoacylase [Nitrospirota bacterium]